MYLQNVIVRMSGQGAAFVIGIIASAISVRVFGIEAIGKIGYMVAYVGLFAIFLNAGFANYYIRNIAQNRNISQDISNYFFINILLVMAFVVIAIIAYSVAERDVIDNYLYVISVVFIVANQINGVFINTLIAKEKFVVLFLGSLLSAVVKLILLLLLYAVWQSIVGLALLMIAEQGVQFLYYKAIVNKIDFRIVKPKKSILNQYWSYTRPLFFLTLQSNLFVHLDKIMVAYFVDKRAVGFLLCAQAFLGGFEMIIKSISNTLFPKLSKDVLSDKSRFEEKFSRVINFNSFMSGILSIQFFVFSDPIVRLMYGEKNIYIASLAKVYAFYILFRLFVRANNSLLLVLEKHRFYSYFQTVATPIVTIFLYVLLIPKNFMGFNCFGIGVMGIPVSLIVKIIISIILLCAILRDDVPMKIFAQAFVTIGTAVFAIVLSCYVNLSENYWVNILYTFMAANGSFFIICYLRGIFNKKDYQYVLSAIAPINIYNYLKRELIFFK